MLFEFDCKCCDGKMRIENPFSKNYPKKYICTKCGATAILKESGQTTYYNADGKIVS